MAKKTKNTRLYFERIRLGLTQVQMARLGGVVERTYVRYEHGERKPCDRFLRAVAEQGVNVEFILDQYAEHPSKNNLAKRLIEERNRLQLDQETIAKVGGVPTLHYSKFEEGTMYFDSQFLLNISQLGINIDYVLTGEKHENR